MMRLTPSYAALAASFAPVAWAQQSGWVQNQVNATMCYWEQLRAAVVKDTMYLDGGELWWIPGMKSGEYGTLTADGNPLGLVYTLNFSQPFNTTQNITSILGTLSKAPGGGAANNIAPNYYDGAMLANDHEWFLYGGLLKPTDAFSPPPGDTGNLYRATQYGVDKPGFRPGQATYNLPAGMTRYVAYGGAASAPSENKAWYFSGFRSESGGPIHKSTTNQSTIANVTSNTLITLDMGTQLKETWSNVTLSGVTGRANPELVWVPVGAQGILVAMGGVVYPDFDNVVGKSVNEGQSAKDSPKFMSTIDIYDIASGKWYQQTADGSPGQITRGCAVVAPAQDYSSFNIYYYGGYDGIHSKDQYKDDVWILSLPSFMWMKISPGTGDPGHARAGHKCAMPYPDQMIVVGGYTAKSGSQPACVQGVAQVFNLTSGKWMDRYDPNVWNKYGVPEMIHLMIGGNAAGGATQKSPTEGWSDPALASVFATPYPKNKLVVHYPYASLGTSNSSKPAGESNDGGGGGGGIPSYLPPLLGTLAGVMLITAIVVAVMLYRRRKLLKKRGTSDPSTSENGHRVMSWMRGQPPSDHKAPTVTTTEDPPLSPDMEPATLVSTPRVVYHQELADTQVAELMDTSHPPRHELYDTGLTPVDIINKHTHFAPGRSGLSPTQSSIQDSLHYSSTAQTAAASTVSRVSDTRHQHQGSSNVSIRPDSPPLGTPSPSPQGPSHAPSPPAAASPVARGESGVSGISERERSHLRNLSDGTVSSVDTTNTSAANAPYASTQHQHQQQWNLSPVMEPDTETETYSTAAGTNNPSAAAMAALATQHQMHIDITSPVSAGGPGEGTLSMVSPPTPPKGFGEGDDYMTPRRPTGLGGSPGGSAGSTLRRSVFIESEDDLGGEGPQDRGKGRR